jgi:lipopolysaccharide transport system ATP-binding protein
MKENEVLVKVEGLSKKFCKDLKTSLWYGVKDLYSNIGGNKNSSMLRDKEFWAVKDISFELRRGECLGLIGHNGAGKSTLLKILNGLIKPDVGKVTIKGKVGALIELGVGFNPILSGRENVFNNGAVLGFTRKEINGKIEEIIDFAEIREFIDMPVQNYSSGMKVRLGFAIAAQMEPDVLIIDEVLAVGDVSFRAKCYERISELMHSCCVILVTHSMSQVSKICTRSILMHRGQVEAQGNNGEVIEAYYDDNHIEDKPTLVHSDKCFLESFNINENVFKGEIKNLEIDISVISEIAIDEIDIGIFLMSRELIPICQVNSKMFNKKISLQTGCNRIKFTIDELHLNTGTYKFALTIESLNPNKIYLWIQNLNPIKVFNKFTLGSPIIIKGNFS